MTIFCPIISGCIPTISLKKARHALVLEKVGKTPRMDVATNGLIGDIKSLSGCEDTIDMLRGVEAAYIKYFSHLCVLRGWGGYW